MKYKTVIMITFHCGKRNCHLISMCAANHHTQTAYVRCDPLPNIDLPLIKIKY